MADEPTSDLVEQVSPFAFAPTVDRLVAAIRQAGLMLFATIDHAAGAREVGLTMPPATVLIYGSPKGGTPIMLAALRAALDLPLRVLVREEADGRVIVAFHAAVSMLRPAGVPDDMSVRLEPAQHLLLHAIAP